jgi:hypothetical protein
MPTGVEPRPEGGRGDVWEAGHLYEAYVGRWSRAVAAEFLAALGAPAAGAGSTWAAAPGR